MDRYRLLDTYIHIGQLRPCKYGLVHYKARMIKPNHIGGWIIGVEPQPCDCKEETMGEHLYAWEYYLPQKKKERTYMCPLCGKNIHLDREGYLNNGHTFVHEECALILKDAVERLV